MDKRGQVGFIHLYCQFATEQDVLSCHTFIYMLNHLDLCKHQPTTISKVTQSTHIKYHMLIPVLLSVTLTTMTARLINFAGVLSMSFYSMHLQTSSLLTTLQ